MILSVKKFVIIFQLRPIRGQLQRTSAIEAMYSSSIPGWVKSKTIKICIHSFLRDVQR